MSTRDVFSFPFSSSRKIERICYCSLISSELPASFNESLAARGSQLLLHKYHLFCPPASPGLGTAAFPETTPNRRLLPQPNVLLNIASPQLKSFFACPSTEHVAKLFELYFCVHQIDSQLLRINTFIQKERTERLQYFKIFPLGALPDLKNCTF